MAKANSLITLRGTHDGITFVKSPTYGDHVRAARGTHKKAKVNAAFKAQSSTHFLVCVRVDGWEQGTVCSALSAKGMRVVAVGRIPARKSAAKPSH